MTIFQKVISFIIIGMCWSQETVDLQQLCSVFFWLWRPIREWQSLPHLEHLMAVAGLLATHTVRLWSFFSSTFTCCVSSYCDHPSFTVCLLASLSVAPTSQESVFMPSAWRSRLHNSLKRRWGRPVGLFSVESSPYKRSFGLRPSVIHVTCPILASLMSCGTSPSLQHWQSISVPWGVFLLHT